MAEEKKDKAEIVSSNKKFKLEEIPVNTGAAGNASTQIVARGRGGRFVKREETRIDPKTVIQQFRENMLKVDSETGQSVLEELFWNMVDIANMSPETPVFDKLGDLVRDSEGKPLTVKDAKSAMASSKAFETLMTRTWGRPDPSDEVLDAQRMSGVKVVVIQQQPLEKPAKEFTPATAPEPKFLEAEITTNK